jgi:hypothetical protein
VALDFSGEAAVEGEPGSLRKIDTHTIHPVVLKDFFAVQDGDLSS